MRKARGWLILIAVCALGILGGRRACLRAADTLEDAAKKIPKAAQAKTPQYLTKSAILPILEEGQKLKARLSQARAIVVRLDNETIQTKSKFPTVHGVFEPIHAGLTSKPKKTDEYGGGMLSRLDYIEKNLSQSLAVLGKAATSKSVLSGRKQLVDALNKVKQAKSQANWTIGESKKLITAAVKRESKDAATASNLNRYHGQLKSGLDEVAALLDEGLKSKPLSQKNLMSIGAASAGSPKADIGQCSNWAELNPLIDKCNNSHVNAQIRCDSLPPKDVGPCLEKAERDRVACMEEVKKKCKPPKCKCPAPCGKEIDSPCSPERCAQFCPTKCLLPCCKETDSPCTEEGCKKKCPAKCKCPCGKEIDSPCTEARCKLECPTKCVCKLCGLESDNSCTDSNCMNVCKVPDADVEEAKQLLETSAHGKGIAGFLEAKNFKFVYSIALSSAYPAIYRRGNNVIYLYKPQEKQPAIYWATLIGHEGVHAMQEQRGISPSLESERDAHFTDLVTYHEMLSGTAGLPEDHPLQQRYRQFRELVKAGKYQEFEKAVVGKYSQERAKVLEKTVEKTPKLLRGIHSWYLEAVDAPFLRQYESLDYQASKWVGRFRKDELTRSVEEAKALRAEEKKWFLDHQEEFQRR